MKWLREERDLDPFENELGAVHLASTMLLAHSDIIELPVPLVLDIEASPNFSYRHIQNGEYRYSIILAPQ